MVKLQKTDSQQRRHSLQPCTSTPHGPLVSTKSSSRNAGQPVTPSSPRSRHKSRMLPPSAWSNSQGEADPQPVKSFEHTYSQPDTAFRATGREEFLKRASIIAHGQKHIAEADASSLRSPVRQSKDASPLQSLLDHDDSFAAIRPGQQTRFVGSGNLLVRDLAQKSSSVQKSGKGSANSPITHIVSRKRSASLPTLEIPHIDSPVSTEVSAERNQPHLPFAPQIDLDTMLESVSASYSQKLAEAQRKSEMLWKRTFVNQREENREVGYLKKKQNRRLTSPALTTPSVGKCYTDMKPGCQPTTDRTSTEDKDSCSMDLSSANLIHPAFRAQSREADAKRPKHVPERSSRFKENITSSVETCRHCGHPQTVTDTSAMSDALKETGHFDGNACDNLESSHSKTGAISSVPSSTKNVAHGPTTPTEVTIAERAAAARAILQAASSQESVVSSKTCDNVKQSHKSPYLQSRNKSEGDFVSSTRKDGWPMRMTNWKGPFAKDAMKGNAAGEVSRDTDVEALRELEAHKRAAHQPVSKDVIESTNRQPSPNGRRRSRRLVIGEQSNDSPQDAGNESEGISLSSRIDLELQSRECRSPSIYSTEIPSPLVVSQNGSDSPTGSAIWLDEQVVCEDEHEAHDGAVLDGGLSVINATNSLPLDESNLIKEAHSRSLPALRAPTPTREYMRELDATEYTLDISRSSKRASRSMVQISETPLNPYGAADQKPQLSILQGKNHVIAIQIQPRIGPQSLNQFRNNCRPIDEPPSPKASRSSARVRFEERSPLHLKSQTEEQVRSRKRLSKPQPIPQDSSGSAQKQTTRREHRANVAQPDNSTTQPEHSPNDSRRDKTKRERPEIPPRTKAGLSDTHTTQPASRQDEERRSRNRLPPNSFPTSKDVAAEPGRERSRSRSRIRSMLQKIGLSDSEEQSTNMPAHKRPDRSKRIRRASANQSSDEAFRNVASSSKRAQQVEHN